MPESIETVADLQDELSGERIAMVTTADERGTLSSRPVTVQKIADDGDVWFVVGIDADWVKPADGGPINAAIAGDDIWVSFAGRAVVSTDSAQVDPLMNDVSSAWFNDGDTPAALRLVTDRIEWWAAPNKAAQLFELAKAKVTDEKPDMGSSGTIES